MPADWSIMYNCPDCKSQRIQHTTRDNGHWTFHYDRRGFKVPGKFIANGKILSLRCPDCGLKREIEVL